MIFGPPGGAKAIQYNGTQPPTQAFLGELVFHPSPQTPAQPETTFLICVVSDQ